MAGLSIGLPPLILQWAQVTSYVDESGCREPSVAWSLSPSSRLSHPLPAPSSTFNFKLSGEDRSTTRLSSSKKDLERLSLRGSQGAAHPPPIHLVIMVTATLHPLRAYPIANAPLLDQGSPFSINGGACVAMVGKDCVGIACDLRLGMQALTVSNHFPKIFNYGDVYLGLTGLATDVSTVADLFRYKVNMYRLREERAISPQTMANLVSSSLYERRFGPYFVSPVVAGINPTTGKPFICGFDSIGCIDFAKDFIVSGTASDQLFGTCEGLWEPDLGPEDLFETISQALLNAVDRDALSGWGAHVYIIEKDKVTKRLLKGRQD
ncbi:MAG: proteasome core particle subunit beta 3 [Phylliscum demangeonii]|nr:MAG: proteasome core particle subunit beta 3 [Phylliscum demangeonii]